MTREPPSENLCPFTCCSDFIVFVRLVLLGIVSSVPSQETGWEERLRNDLFCVEWDVKASDL